MSFFKKNKIFFSMCFFLLLFVGKGSVIGLCKASQFNFRPNEILPGSGQHFKNITRDKVLCALQHFIKDAETCSCHRHRYVFEGMLSPTSYVYTERHTGDWSTLENKMRQQGQKSFQLLGFGSLMEASVSRSFPVRKTPAIAIGVRRFFGYALAAPEKSLLGVPEAPYTHELLRLSTRITGNKNDLTNGLLLDVHLGPEMDAFRARERGYDLVKVPIIKIVQKGGASPKRVYAYDEAYILTESKKKKGASQAGKAEMSDCLAPHLAYLYICLRGAKSLSESFFGDSCFAHIFLQTTFLADDKTPLSHWIKNPSEG